MFGSYNVHHVPHLSTEHQKFQLTFAYQHSTQRPVVAVFCSWFGCATVLDCILLLYTIVLNLNSCTHAYIFTLLKVKRKTTSQTVKHQHKTQQLIVARQPVWLLSYSLISKSSLQCLKASPRFSLVRHLAHLLSLYVLLSISVHILSVYTHIHLLLSSSQSRESLPAAWLVELAELTSEQQLQVVVSSYFSNKESFLSSRKLHESQQVEAEQPEDIRLKTRKYVILSRCWKSVTCNYFVVLELLSWKQKVPHVTRHGFEASFM